MMIEQLDKFHQARPFEPFTIHLADGSKHRVVSPRTPGGRTIAVSAERDAMAIIDLLLVAKITKGNGVHRRRRRPQK